MPTSMDEATTFAILDLESGNAVAFYERREETEDALRLTIRARLAEADHLMLIGYDKDGGACGQVTGPSLLSPGVGPRTVER